MPFDATAYPTARPTAPQVPTAALIDAAGDLCPVWAAENPDRALAFLFVAPRDGAAIDSLIAL